MKITEKEYLEALEIVKSYKAQIDSDLEIIKLNKLKLLSEVVTGDFITPLVLNKTNNSNWTIGNRYEVIDVRDFYLGRKNNERHSRIRVRNDKGNILDVSVYLLKSSTGGYKLNNLKLNHKWKVIN